MSYFMLFIFCFEINGGGKQYHGSFLKVTMYLI